MRSSWLYLATRSERAGAPVLICPTAGRHHEVRDQRVLGLPGTMRDDRSILGVCRHRHRLQGLGQGPDLVELDQDRVGDARVDAAAQDAPDW